MVDAKTLVLVLVLGVWTNIVATTDNEQSEIEVYFNRSRVLFFQYSAVTCESIIPPPTEGRCLT